MRFAHHNFIYERLGVAGETLPAHGATGRLINVAAPAGPELVMPVYILPPQGGKHRVRAVCRCTRHLPVGRLGQHARACEELKIASAIAEGHARG